MAWWWVVVAFIAGAVFGFIVIAVCAANDAYLHGGYRDNKKGGA